MERLTRADPEAMKEERQRERGGGRATVGVPVLLQGSGGGAGRYRQCRTGFCSGSGGEAG